MNAKLKLLADFVNVEGRIGNVDLWRTNDSLVRADILRDWIYDLEQEYNLALKQFWSEVRADNKEAKAKELKGLAGEILKQADVIQTKTVFVMRMPEKHKALLIPEAIEKAEKWLSDNSNGWCEIVFQTEREAKE